MERDERTRWRGERYAAKHMTRQAGGRTVGREREREREREKQSRAAGYVCVRTHGLQAVIQAPGVRKSH